MSDNAKKVFVDMAIQKALLESGSVTLEKVSNSLFEIYRSHLSDCYYNPEYLREVLKDTFGDSHIRIVESIRTHLQSVSYHKQIEVFLLKAERPIPGNSMQNTCLLTKKTHINLPES